MCLYFTNIHLTRQIKMNIIFMMYEFEFKKVCLMRNNKDLDNHILNILRNFEIREQTDLQTNLQKQGHKVSQSTLSRLLKRLNVAKIAGEYRIIEQSQLQLPMVLNMKISDFGLIVLHTHPGNASSLAFFLDQKYVSYSSQANNESLILGTIAGDDTVLVISKNKDSVKEVIQLLKIHIPYLHTESL